MVLKSGLSTSTVRLVDVVMLRLVSIIDSTLCSSTKRCIFPAYVHSVMDVQNNLYLRCNARGSRVLFDDNNKAIGVAYVPSRNRANGAEVQETVVMARKMVVISSGTLGTPQILERSGVGNGEMLNQLGIKVVSDRPGVG